jgi:hypothetical protein
MRTELLADLIRQTKQKIAVMSSDWMTLSYREVPKPMYFKALPLDQEGQLFGVDLYWYMQVYTPLNFLEFVDVYESQVLGDLAGNRMMFPELCEALQITQAEGNSVFQEYEFNSVLWALPGLAMIAHRNFSGEVEWHGFYNLKITVGNCQFGVWNNRGLSNRGEAPLNHGYNITRAPTNYYKRRMFVSSPLTELFSNIYHNLKDEGAPKDDLDELKLAFTLMLGNDSQLLRNTWLVGDTLIHQQPETLFNAVELASEYRLYINPISYLRSQLVPLVISLPEFSKLIGLNRKMSDDRYPVIDNALQQIKINLMKEREAVIC